MNMVILFIRFGKRKTNLRNSLGIWMKPKLGVFAHPPKRVNKTKYTKCWFELNFDQSIAANIDFINRRNPHILKKFNQNVWVLILDSLSFYKKD